MTFLFKAKKIAGYSLSTVGAYAIYRNDIIAEKIFDYLEQKSKSFIYNPMNSKRLIDEKEYMKDIV
jgi:hypothetical protein